ncbi:ABC transporter ATP-binding protein [Gleimia hominis]|uniref:ABC transporter ATP-binding protein n=1 Tax=Gleimia hominis TaxID=595468 RepID=A0ABU3ICC7_9ACTO|nr:ABC transporter ATP-binding protein [Gleimia hominis]MDT3766865.1 ABC transporter ATP-binding protein [Gleimia hominis]
MHNSKGLARGATHDGHANEQTPILDCHQLVVDRGKRRVKNRVLRAIDCELPHGSITGLMGPSGCGKSTFMRAIVGAQTITSGTLEVCGYPAGHRALRHLIGYTSQDKSIYTDISVRDNVAYFARLQHASMKQVDQVIARVGLANLATRRVDQLSGGQANRASLACALVGDPQLLVLDEPTVGLDPLTRENLWDLFTTLAHSGVTLLVSSHVMDEAARCDSVLFMRNGQFLAHKPVAQLQEETGTNNPEEAFLALIKESN